MSWLWPLKGFPRFLLVPVFVCLASVSGSRAATYFTTTGTTWKLRRGQSEASNPTTSWRGITFDASGWDDAPAPILYSTAPTEPPFYNGGSFTGTTLAGMQGSYSSAFLRRTFSVANPAAVSQLTLTVAIDDGFIAWINGVEVARTNVSGLNPPFNALANATFAEPLPVISFTVQNPAAFLVAGTNVLAVQAFNGDLNSSDFGFMAGLSSPSDDAPPVVTTQLPPAGLRVGDLDRIEVNFSEAVSNVSAGDLLLNGVQTTGVTAGSSTRYVFTGPQPSAGLVSVSWAPGHGIRDLAGNDFAGAGWTYTYDSSATLPAVLISEFMAANLSTLADEDGDYSDWIELFNPGFSSVNLGGWFLTDNADQLDQWSFPSVSLPSGGRMLVFASGKNRRVAGQPLHANFQLSAEGEYLALVKPDGTIVSSAGPDVPVQQRDVSYGLVTGTGTNGFLLGPTPGGANSDSTMEFVADTKFSHRRGFYTAAFDLVISCATPGATIYYTTNGLPPGPGSGPVYTGPIRISRTTTLRARAEKPGARASNVDTHSYFFVADVVQQSPNGQTPAGWPSSWGANRVDYGMDPDITTRSPWNGTIQNDLRAIPTLSLVMKLDDLFDDETGIYSNPFGEGHAWERPGSLELIYPDGSDGFQLDAGVRLRGGFSRMFSNPKHSLRILCRDDYGPARLRFPLFGSDGANSFDRFDLRTAQDNSYALQGDSRGMFVVDSFARDTLRATGQPSERGAWYHLYINGQYWGLYNTCERPEANFAASYFGGAAEDYDVLKPDPDLDYVMKPTDGDDAAWTRLWQAAKSGFAGNAAYFKVQGRNADGSPNATYENLLEVTNLVDYLLTMIYIGNNDGPIGGDLNTGFLNNFYAFRERHNQAGGFRFIAHDSEVSLQGLYDNRAGTSTLGGDGPDHLNPIYLATRLRANAEFKMLFADRIQKHFFNGGAMSVESVGARFRTLTNELHQAITGESARWGDAQRSSPITRNDWLDAVGDKLADYFPYRTDVVLEQLRAEHLFPSVTAPEFSPNAGEVTFGTGISLNHGNADGTIYFTLDGSDPRAIGGGLNGAAVNYSSPITITSSRLIRARVKSGSNWSPLVEAAFYPAQDYSGLRFTELMYNPPGEALVSGDEYEFLELKNTGGTTLDLGGAFFTGITFAFTNGSRIAPGAFVVLARNPVLLKSRNPGLSVYGTYAGRLDNAGERITLHTALGTEMVSVNYSDRAPWPAAADGEGFSIVPINPTADTDPSDGLQWRASRDAGGSPGENDPAPNLAPIRINEILAHTDPPQTDSIELFNPTASAVNLTGWYLTDDPRTPRKFRITGVTIPAGGYRVFDEDDFNAGGAGFALSSLGDEVYLFSGSANGTNLTGYSYGASFGGSANGVTFGRYINSVGEEQFPAQTTATLGDANSGPRLGAAVLNEIHYHPALGGDEYVEIRNVSGGSLNLFDLARPTNTWRINGLGFDFPANVTLPAGGLALVVRLDPTVFRAKYGVPAGTLVLGPFNGQLQDSGERLELQRPDAPETNGVAPYITVDSVRYNDRFPWPVSADGDGASLQRLVATAYADDPTNWYAATPTPGRANQQPAIIRQPLSQSAPPGTDVAFSVQALGTGLRYQWQFNGGSIAGETNDTLVLSPISVSDAGNYRVVVSDASNSATSAVATLTVTCAFALSQAEELFQASGGEGEVSVTTEGDCEWTISGLPDWIVITSTGLGHGSGMVTYVVEAQESSVVRQATLTIAGRAYLVTQAPVDRKIPTVTVTQPAAGARTTNGSVQLVGTARDESGIQRVEYQIGSGPFIAAAGTTSWNAAVPLAAGTNVLRVRSVDLAGNYSATNQRSVICVAVSPITIHVVGQGGVTGASDGQSLEVGRVYTLTATPAAGMLFSNWTGQVTGVTPKLSFVMQSNLIVTANFVPNPFVAAAGTYNGLFYEDEEVRHGRSGFLTLKVTDRGAYSARLLSGGLKLSASGQLNLTGTATNVISRSGMNALTVTWAVALDGSDRVEGFVRDTVTPWSAELVADRARFNAKTNPCPHAGVYTFRLPGSPNAPLIPGGDSYGTVTIDSNGTAKVKAYLADTTSGAQTVAVSQDGDLPLYLPVSASHGSVLAWLRFTSQADADFRGLASWTRSAGKGSFYTNGFVVVTNLVGARYVPPQSPIDRVLNLDQAAVEFRGGDLATAHTNTVTIGLNNKVTSDGPGKLSLTFTLSSGLFSGSFTPVGATRALAFKGAVLQKGTNAAGFFRGTNETGRVLLEGSSD